MSPWVERPMKLVIFSLVTALFAGTALADNGPPGMQGAPVVEVDYRGPQRPARGELRQAILDRFDRNHDGRLEPNERRHAVRALRQLARRLAREDRNERIGQRRAQRLIQKYDANRDGNVDAGEVPPNVARRLRHLDRNGDGWVDGNELAPRR